MLTQSSFVRRTTSPDFTDNRTIWFCSTKYGPLTVYLTWEPELEGFRIQTRTMPSDTLNINGIQCRFTAAMTLGCEPDVFYLTRNRSEKANDATNAMKTRARKLMHEIADTMFADPYMGITAIRAHHTHAVHTACEAAQKAIATMNAAIAVHNEWESTIAKQGRNL